MPERAALPVPAKKISGPSVSKPLQFSSIDLQVALDPIKRGCPRNTWKTLKTSVGVPENLLNSAVKRRLFLAMLMPPLGIRAHLSELSKKVGPPQSLKTRCQIPIQGGRPRMRHTGWASQNAPYRVGVPECASTAYPKKNARANASAPPAILCGIDRFLLAIRIYWCPTNARTGRRGVTCTCR